MSGERRPAALGCVLMASGFGRRFGGNKLLARAGGLTLIQRTFQALPAGLFTRAVAVSRYQEVLELAGREGYTPLFNPGAEEGVSASIRLGLGELLDLDGVLFAVCDQPGLRRESVERLAARFQARPDRIAALSWEGRRGNPVIFPSDLFPELLALTGDRGGSAVLRAHPRRLVLVEAGGPEELEDVDRPGDLKG